MGNIIEMNCENSCCNRIQMTNKSNAKNIFITHINSNLDVFCGIDALFTEKNKINFEKVKQFYNFINKYFN